MIYHPIVSLLEILNDLLYILFSGCNLQRLLKEKVSREKKWKKVVVGIAWVEKKLYFCNRFWKEVLDWRNKGEKKWKKVFKNFALELEAIIFALPLLMSGGKRYKREGKRP